MAILLLSVLCLGAVASADEPHAEAPTEHTDHVDHGEAGADAHGPGGHGGGHGGGISNWFHWPGEKHPNGPLGFAIINFIILIYVVVRIGKKPFVDFLEKRHSTVRDNLAEASRLRGEAEKKLEEIKGKLNNLQQEITEIKNNVKKDAELEKERIIADAKAQAEHLVLAADRSLEEELKRARRMLEREAVSAAMTSAEKLIRQKINESDRKRINDEYFQHITGGSPGSPVGGAGGAT
jgi:F-type H+-transporting ATPase subunit b